MSTIYVPDRNPRTVGFSGASARWSLAAAALLLGSAALQLVASLQRWFVFRYSFGEFRLEDHLFDYYFPWDPWENIGTAAQLFGIGILLLAAGILAMALGVVTLPRTTTRHRVVGIIADVLEITVAALIAGSFALHGAHAIISGVTGTPSPLQQYAALGWVGIIGLIALTVRWARRSPAAMMACLFLMGATGLGYVIATYQIAPIFAGYVSHDTTPWTETVIAVWTAAAGVAMILAAGDVARRRERSAVAHATAAVVPEK